MKVISVFTRISDTVAIVCSLLIRFQRKLGNKQSFIGLLVILFCFFSPSVEDMMMEPEEVSQPMETALSLDQTAGGEFLSLDELGKVLSQLASRGLIPAFDFFKKSFIMCICH